MTKGMFKLNKTFSRVLNEENIYSFSADGSKDTYKIELFKNETNNYLLRKDEEYYKITYTTLPEEEVDIDIINSKAKYNEAVVTKYYKKSNNS